MKTVIVFLVLLATVYCKPVKRSVSSSESSEEVVRPFRLWLKEPALLHNAEPTQTTGSDESSDSSDEAQQSDTTSEDSDDTDENDTESDESEESTEAPTIEPPVIYETTLVPVTDSGRGDNLGYVGGYKKDDYYVESNKIDQGSSLYKYYDMGKVVESMGLVSKKASAYNSKGGNDIEKNLKVYKALQARDDDEEDASTPEVESQGLDSVGGMAEVPTLRQTEPDSEAAAAEGAGTGEEESISTGVSDSSSTSEEEEESQSSQSSEETTATPGDSSQSSESLENDYTEAPIIFVAK